MGEEPAGLSVYDAAMALGDIGRRFYERGWLLGTSGNLSAVLSRDPLRLLITRSGAHKGRLRPSDFLEIDGAARALSEAGGRPSAETRLHLEIVQTRGAAAVLHTHSVWSTILSDRHASAAGVAIAGYEMLKGLDGVETHEHREWLPILENDQDIGRLAGVAGERLRQHPQAHGYLLRRHGLYTWGRTIEDAERHVEILEFLLEAVGRLKGGGDGDSQDSR